MRLAILFLLALTAALPAAEVEFAARLPPGSTDQPATDQQRADKERLAAAMVAMLQAESFSVDAQLEHAAAQLELQRSLAAMGSIDAARMKIITAQQRLVQAAADADAKGKAYQELLGEMKTRYHAEACQFGLSAAGTAFVWLCPGNAEKTEP